MVGKSDRLQDNTLKRSYFDNGKSVVKMTKTDA